MRRSVRNLGLGLWLVVLIVWLGRFSLYALAGLAVVAAIALIGYGVETRTRRPLRSYARLSLASAILFLVLVIGVASWGGAVRLGAMFWVTMTVMGTIWVVHFERTEPLR